VPALLAKFAARCAIEARSELPALDPGYFDETSTQVLSVGNGDS
jgi:hypothetical protein